MPNACTPMEYIDAEYAEARKQAKVASRLKKHTMMSGAEGRGPELERVVSKQSPCRFFLRGGHGPRRPAL